MTVFSKGDRVHYHGLGNGTVVRVGADDRSVPLISIDMDDPGPGTNPFVARVGELTLLPPAHVVYNLADFNYKGSTELEPFRLAGFIINEQKGIIYHPTHWREAQGDEEGEFFYGPNEETTFDMVALTDEARRAREVEATE
jgi:hypothetical protein